MTGPCAATDRSELCKQTGLHNSLHSTDYFFYARAPKHLVRSRQRQSLNLLARAGWKSSIAAPIDPPHTSYAALPDGIRRCRANTRSPRPSRRCGSCSARPQSRAQPQGTEHYLPTSTTKHSSRGALLALEMSNYNSHVHM